MIKISAWLVLGLMCTYVSANAQTGFILEGRIQDENSIVVPGLRLEVKDDTNSLSVYTDINGEFHVPLSNGDHVITAGDVPANKFRAFVKVSEKGLNPGYLVFIIESDAIPCIQKAEAGPKIIRSAIPQYPPAAKAVRAFGEVAVDIKVNADGTSSNAKPVRGHPLLRSAAKSAAEKFQFNTSNENIEREVQLVFVFLLDGEMKPGLKRWECPFRINIVSPPETIDTTTSQSKP